MRLHGSHVPSLTSQHVQSATMGSHVVGFTSVSMTRHQRSQRQLIAHEADQVRWGQCCADAAGGVRHPPQRPWGRSTTVPRHVGTKRRVTGAQGSPSTRGGSRPPHPMRHLPHAQHSRKTHFRRSERFFLTCSGGAGGLEPNPVTPPTCTDTEGTDRVTRFQPAASPSIRLERGSVRRSPHDFFPRGPLPLLPSPHRELPPLRHRGRPRISTSLSSPLSLHSPQAVTFRSRCPRLSTAERCAKWRSTEARLARQASISCRCRLATR